MPSIPTVHPRACGEHLDAVVETLRAAGSSPRLRGTHRGRGPLPERLGFIPAPAGNTRAGFRLHRRFTVHPRACGEHCHRSQEGASAAGSSPRLRGTRDGAVVHVHVHRFIPAPAGNTLRDRAAPRTGPVHPRACGEHPGMIVHSGDYYGSSPRLRGTPVAEPSLASPFRFIPAPAGNTTRPSGRGTSLPVHPRACGEHIEELPHGDGRSGSSPRLRGTPEGGARVCRHQRFIPAPAGNTRPAGGSAPCPSVHPRACGEHIAWNA